MFLRSLIFVTAGLLVLPVYRAAAQDAPKREPVITFSTRPSPVLLGQNRFHVALARPGGTPIAGADVAVLLVMPAQPEIKHPEMRSEFKLKDLGHGHYEGIGLVTMAGKWNVTVRATQQGKLLTEKKLTLTANESASKH